ncbi:MAG: UDP-N-acetylmuramate--L-alanine ligase [Candidatus Bipolaricaulota bacterium]|nr:UDP-N-acetylmuramate--L-alanine ligase [Candidatus Bipolaricaulota bacterium]MCS7274442.1 UDP-N-acetylmuramate--L-alanine ligase [Candidatus Bipolaricaulota bacterium]MDW8110871.1 UDP-N-acetylmuramate--L-alanine ligase [Candidatus Bipolaricaulota bacterium]MDW8328648.1 UDP-N-acetylmuramate--L-alanine ligase [Candidatus Bipolaricaulota bacterium]
MNRQKKPKTALHFVGIGGDGMSALAKVCHEMGFAVSGSNICENQRTRELRALGLPIALGHDASHLQDADAVVFSSAIPTDNVELRAARRRGLPIVHRLELLRTLMSDRYSIGVTGTHGKTTTAAMIATLLMRAQLDPTFIVGAASPTLGTHARFGRGRHLVAEVCESDGYFLQLHPQIAVVTSIGRDHLSTYGSEHALRQSFRQFVQQSERAVVCADDPGIQEAILQESHAALTYRIERPADLVAYDLELEGEQTRFAIAWRGRPVGAIELNVPGKHNIYNALAALSVGRLLGLTFQQMAAYLREFQLPERRFEFLLRSPMVLIDDYAHLPEQIQTNLETIRTAWRPARVIALFQPHRYSRLSYLGEEFGRAFALADEVIVTDIYAAFESPIEDVNIGRLLEALRRHHARVRYLSPGEDLSRCLQESCRPGDWVIAFNAGDLSHRLRQAAMSFGKGVSDDGIF